MPTKRGGNLKKSRTTLKAKLKSAFWVARFRNFAQSKMRKKPRVLKQQLQPHNLLPAFEDRRIRHFCTDTVKISDRIQESAFTLRLSSLHLADTHL